ncbi:unnamed protein product, partial [Dibothriocephalus latus]
MAGSFWKGTEEDRLDAGFPDDVDHMMLAFHPKTHRRGSSCASGCNRPFTLSYRTNSSSCALHPLTGGPVSTSSRSSLDSQRQLPKSINRHRSSLPEDRQVTFQQITSAMNAPAEALRDSMTSSDSVHSLPPVHLVNANDTPSSSCKAETVLSREEGQPGTDFSDSFSLSASHESSKASPPQPQPLISTDEGDYDDAQISSVTSEAGSTNSSVGGETVVHDSEPAPEGELERTRQAQSETVQRDGSVDSMQGQKGGPVADNEIDKRDGRLDGTLPSDALKSSQLPESSPKGVTDGVVDQEDSVEVQKEASLEAASKASLISPLSSKEGEEESEPLADDASLHTVIEKNSVDGEEEQQLPEDAAQFEVQPDDCPDSNLHSPDAEDKHLHDTTPNITGKEEKASEDADQTTVEAPVQKVAASDLQSPSSPKGATTVTEDEEGQEKVPDQDTDEVKEASLGELLKAIVSPSRSSKAGKEESEPLADDASPHIAVEKNAVDEEEQLSEKPAQSEVQPAHTDDLKTADRPAPSLHSPDAEDKHLH